MSVTGSRPPRLSRRLLEWAAGRLGTPDLADDAADLFAERVRRDSERAGRRWYRRQALATLKPLLFSKPATARSARTIPRSPASRSPAARSPLPRRGVSRLSLLDFKLGVRMLVKYPGLTVVAGVAMAFAIAVGAVTFEFARDAMYPTLPMEDGDRIVRLHQVDRRFGDRTGVAPDEFRSWREALRTVREPGAFHGFARNLWLGGEEVVAVDGVAVSPSAFSMAGVPPLHGRALVEADEAPEAPPVIVLGFDLWRSRFSSDPRAVGRVVRLGTEPATVVGVMPEDFAFPAPADLYVPIGLNELAARAAERDDVPRVTGFGRLAPGATLEEARAELAIVAASAATGTAEEREQVAPVVAPFAYPLVTTNRILTNLLFALTALFVVMLIVVVCANVALLLFARAATREGEMAVRAALGASRGRIVGQLFIEALVLAGVAALAGLLAASAGLKRAMDVMTAGPGDTTPFWIGDTLSPATVGWVVLLAVLAAAIAGVVPALQVTGRGVGASLQRGGRGTGIRLGGVWTGVVVSQVTLTVVFIPIVLAVGSVYWKVRSAERGVAAEEYLAARLEAGGDAERFAGGQRELLARLAAEPWVRGATLASGIWPGWDDAPLEVEGLPFPADPFDAPTSQRLAVDPGFFDVMGAPLLAGRTLTAEDVAAARDVVVVDESFVREVLGGRNAVGRRIRIGGPVGPGRDQLEPWHEIVGVVGDLGLNPFAELPSRAVMYRPLHAGEAARPGLLVRVAGDPAAFANRLRVLALEADPAMRVEEPLPLDYRMNRPVAEYGAWFRVIATAGALAMLLTLAGIYAVMAFTVARRTREIGVRVALGADRRQVARAVFSRAASHVGYGVLAGGAVIPLLMLAMDKVIDEPGSLWPPVPVAGAILALYMTGMLAVCMLACVVPMRRALRVQPTEALAAET